MLKILQLVSIFSHAVNRPISESNDDCMKSCLSIRNQRVYLNSWFWNNIEIKVLDRFEDFVYNSKYNNCKCYWI